MHKLSKTQLEIKGMVDRETLAWDTQDVRLLMSIFHPDFVWPWPKDNRNHNPMGWVMPLGRFNLKRWSKIYQELFRRYKLARNIRNIRRIVVSKERDGAFAVVDIDTLWVDKKGKKDHWKGRVCKVYSKVRGEWKLTMHTGVLEY